MKRRSGGVLKKSFDDGRTRARARLKGADMPSAAGESVLCALESLQRPIAPPKAPGLIHYSFQDRQPALSNKRHTRERPRSPVRARGRPIHGAPRCASSRSLAERVHARPPLTPRDALNSRANHVSPGLGGPDSVCVCGGRCARRALASGERASERAPFARARTPSSHPTMPFFPPPPPQPPGTRPPRRRRPPGRPAPAPSRPRPP